MSQSIGIGRALGPILQHIPNASSSCMFLSTEHTNVGFPINLSTKGNPRLLSVVSKRNPRLPLLPCAATMKSNVVVDEDGTSNKGKYDDPLKVLLLGVSQVWWTLLSNIRSWFRYRVSKEVVVTMIRMDRHDPIDGLRVLLDVSRAWRRVLSITAGDGLYDPKEFDDHYGKSYLRKARMYGGTNKGKPNKVKNSPSRITTRQSIIRILADLKDPNDGLEVLSGALELWRTKFSSNELNDSEGYLQKEILAIRDLSHRITVSNRNGKHDKAKNPSLMTIHLLELYKLIIDHFEDPEDADNARREAFRCYREGVECDGVLGLMVDAVANLCWSVAALISKRHLLLYYHHWIRQIVLCRQLNFISFTWRLRITRLTTVLTGLKCKTFLY